MALLKLQDANTATIYGFPPNDTDTAALQTWLVGMCGWTNADAMRHISAAIRAGAYKQEGGESTKKEAAQGAAEVTTHGSL